MTCIFFDTNIFLYAIDSRDRRKQDIALRRLAEGTASGTATVSTQLMQEFADAAARKFGLAYEAIAEWLRLAEHQFHIVPTTPPLIQQALAIAAQYQLRMYDALIIAAATTAGCEVVATEDLNHGQRYGSVLVQNPFIEETA